MAVTAKKVDRGQPVSFPERKKNRRPPQAEIGQLKGSRETCLTQRVDL